MSSVKQHKEPLLRIAKRDGISRSKAYAIRIVAVILSLVISGIFIFAVTKLNPIQVYEAMFNGAFGSSRRSWVTIRDTMTLLCIGVGLAPAFKMKFWNIGAEGQVLIGGIMTAGLMRAYGNSIPTPVLLVIMAAASLLGGCVWGVIPAAFKAKWNTNETLFTLMMNYVAIQLTSYCVALWENPFGSNTVGQINQQTKGGWFPALFGQTYALNVIIVLALTIGMFLYKKAVQTSQEYSSMVTDTGMTRGKFTEMCFDVKYDCWVIESLSQGIIPIIDAVENTGTFAIPVQVIEPDTSDAKVTKVTVNPATLSLKVGQEAYVNVKVDGTGAFDKGWSAFSSDATKAEVMPDGKVRGIAAGTATITFRSLGDPTKTATVTVNVSATPGA